MTTEYIENDDTSIFLDESLTHQNESRLRSLLDESNKTLLEKENTIENLKSKILELESKINEYELISNELKNCKLHIDEIGIILKVKVQSLENENRSLK